MNDNEEDEFGELSEEDVEMIETAKENEKKMGTYKDNRPMKIPPQNPINDDIPLYGQTPVKERMGPVPRVGRPPLNKAKTPTPEESPKDKFSVMMQPMSLGIANLETNQMVAQGQDADTVILLSLADIINRLDRIERSL